MSPAKDFCQGEGRQVSKLQEEPLPGVSQSVAAGAFIHPAPGISLVEEGGAQLVKDKN